MQSHQLAQINVARLIAPLDDPRIQAFVDQLEPVNRLADNSPGFVWRLRRKNSRPPSARRQVQLQLETPRLFLRPLELADAETTQRLFPHWEIVRFLTNSVSWPYPAAYQLRIRHNQSAANGAAAYRERLAKFRIERQKARKAGTDFDFPSTNNAESGIEGGLRAEIVCLSQCFSPTHNPPNQCSPNFASRY